MKKAYLYLQSVSGGVKSSERYIEHNVPEVYRAIQTSWPELTLFRAKALACKRGFTTLPVCRVCGAPLFRDDNITTWQNLGKENKLVVCSKLCSYRDPMRAKNSGDAQKGKQGTFLNKKHTKQTKEKMSKKAQGRPGNRLGSSCTEETRRRMSEAVKLRISTDSEGFRHSCRKGYLKKVDQGFALMGHNYNTSSIPYLKEIDEKIPHKCYYAPQEKAIKVAHRQYKYPDFYCEGLKLIIEWDEAYHYTKQQLKEDAHREDLLILALGADWKIIRIKEKEYLSYDEQQRHQYIKEVIDRRSN